METTFNRALDMLEQLAAKAGTTVEQMYPLWVKQAWVESLTYLIIGTVIPLALVGGAIVLIIWRKSLVEHPEIDDVGPIICGVLMVVIAIVIFGAVAAKNLPGLLNPEYYGAKDLIHTIQGVTK